MPRPRDSKDYVRILLAVGLTVVGGVILVALAFIILPTVRGDLPALLGVSAFVLLAFAAVGYWIYKSDESSGSAEARTGPPVR